MKTSRKRTQRILLSFFAIASLLIFAKTMLDERNFTGLDRSFNEMYNDRLVVESYIYRLNDLINKKTIVLLRGTAITSKEAHTEILKVNSEIDQLITAYALTKLTPAEKNEFEAFRQRTAKLHHRERAASVLSENLVPGELLPLYNEAAKNLRVLSNIQVAQGRFLASQSHSTLASSQLGLKLEWALYFLVFVTLVALYKNKHSGASQWPTHQLN